MQQAQNTQQYRKMTETPVPKLIISLGVPTIISMLITNVYNMVDTFFVGKLGTSASGAVGIVFGLMAILQAFGFMFGHGAGSIISRKLGQKDVKSANLFASTSFFLAFAVGAIIMVFGLLFLTPLMRLLGSTPTILPYAKQYGVFILLAAPFMVSSCVLNNILRFEGRSIYAMVGLTVGGILNMICDPIFMFGFKWGAVGAGVATALSQMVSFFILLFMLLSGKTASKLSVRFITKDIHDVAEIVKVGFPSLIRQGLGSVSTMLLNGQAAIYGDAAVAAMSIVNRVTMFIFSIGLGMGQGYQPVAAYNYGAGKYTRVKKGFWFTAVAGEILLGSFAVWGIWVSADIIGVFRDDPAVVQVGILALRCQCVACFFQPLMVCTNMMFQSVGENGKAALLSASRSGIFFIPLILILPAVFGITGVQIAQTIADILSFILAIPFMINFLRKLPPDVAQPSLAANQ
ncbi:MAG: MATE family efflux transporter [Oscillospiraceae bacterium]|nr:MATE family efflux transporter [Oscillospiraceae bacterium]